MRHPIFADMPAWLFLLLPIPLVAQPPAGYYDPAGGLSGDALKDALHTIISPHQVQTNASLWVHFMSTDAHPEGHVWDIYSDIPGGAPAYTYTFVEDQCGTYASEGDCYNREHTVPQSWYGSSAPMSTDLFQLHPVDAWVNQQRGNLPYGTVSAPDWVATNGAERGPCTWPGCVGTVFEPIDAFKGDLARTYFYMATRYKDQVAGWTGGMFGPGGFSSWAESLLLQWHGDDPVDGKEEERNNAVFAIQGNRNPYIDRPELVASIWGPSALIAEHGKERLQVHVINGALVVQTGHAMNGTLVLFDATGRIVDRSTLKGGYVIRSLQLPKGAYIAVFQGDHNRLVARFMH